jgi:ankyrin repeat protein
MLVFLYFFIFIVYLSAFSILVDKCLSCNSNLMSTMANPRNNNKRPYSTFDDTDEVDSYVYPTDRMEIKEVDQSHILELITSVPAAPHIKIEDQFMTLENAIQEGNIELAINLIKQSNSYLERRNDQGQTPLLLAARFNQARLIRAILKKRPELAKQVDRQKNNLLHLLAKVSEDSATEATNNIFMILDNKMKELLISGLDEDKQTPEQIAAIHGNRQFIDLLKRQMEWEEENV